MADIGWRRRRGSSPAARRGARQRAGLTPVSASNTLSCQRETLHSQQLRSIKKSIDSDHGIYRGLAPALTDLLAGQVDIMFDNLGNTLQYICNGRLRALATASATRVAELPDVPAIAETYPGFLSTSWFAVVAPPRTPAAIAAKLSRTIAEVLREPEAARQLHDLSLTAVGSTPEDTAALIGREAIRWREAIGATLSKVHSH